MEERKKITTMQFRPKEHFYLLLYVLEASIGRRVTIFNNIKNLDSIS